MEPEKIDQADEILQMVHLYHDGEWYTECHPDEFDDPWKEELTRAKRVYFFSAVPFAAAVVVSWWLPALGLLFAIIGHVLMTTTSRVITQIQIQKTAARLKASNYAILKNDTTQAHLATSWVPWAHGSIEALLSRAGQEDDRIDPTGRIRSMRSDDDEPPILH